MSFHTKLFDFYREMRRRKVFQVASVYLVTAWGLSLGVVEFFPMFGVPDDGVRWFVIIAAVGFPIAVLLAWVYEISGGKVNRDERSLDGAAFRTTRIAHGTNRIAARWTSAGEPCEQSFTGKFVLGRDQDCEIRVDDPMVSRRHAKVFFERGRWRIEDLGSRNGTRVNGELISTMALPNESEVQLHPEGDLIRLSLEQLPQTMAYLTK